MSGCLLDRQNRLLKTAFPVRLPDGVGWRGWPQPLAFATTLAMGKYTDLAVTSIAPLIWGTTYIVTTEFLPGLSPLTVALLRALPAGLLLLLIVRQLPSGIWWLRSFILGALNIAIFLSLLFVSAYRLPGGVAAIVAASQPLIVVFLAALVLRTRLKVFSLLAAVLGMVGVGLMVLTSSAKLDPIGIIAGLGGAVSMACGNVLARKWQPPVSQLAFTAWQLTAGGLLLVPVVLIAHSGIPKLTSANLLALSWIGLVGAAFTYTIWFRGISRLEPPVVSLLIFLSPLTAVMLGWLVLHQTLTGWQTAGALLVIGSILLGQRSGAGGRKETGLAESQGPGA